MLPAQKYDFQALLRSHGGPHLSCYIENRGSPDAVLTALDDAQRKAEAELLAAFPEDDVRGFLKPLTMLQQDRSILSKVAGNIGVFRKEKFFRVMSIPIDVSFASIVATSFHVKPLLRWQQMDHTFFIIGLTDQKWSLYQGNQFQLKQLPIDDIARLRALEHFIMGLPYHERPVVFLVGSLRQTLRFRKRFPFLVARRLRAFKTFETQALGNICFTIRRQLKDDYKQRVQAAFEEYDDAQELGLTSNQLSVIAREAVQGHVRQLIVAESPKIFGKMNWHTGEFKVHSQDMDHEDDDLLDDIAQIVLAKGGSVFVAAPGEMSSQTPALAILHPRSQQFLQPMQRKASRFVLLEKPWLQLTEA